MIRIDRRTAVLLLGFVLFAGSSIVRPAAASATTPPAPGSRSGVLVKETSLQRVQRSVQRINDEASTPEGEARVVKRLAGQLGMPEDSLRARHEAWAIGYGEIAMVYGFARAARRQSATLPDQIVEMRRSGMEWKAIARDLGVSVDAVASRVRRQEPPQRRAP